MLMLTLPKSEPSGTCHINDQPAEYRANTYNEASKDDACLGDCDR